MDNVRGRGVSRRALLQGAAAAAALAAGGWAPAAAAPPARRTAPPGGAAPSPRGVTGAVGHGPVHHGGELRGVLVARRGRTLEGRFGLMVKGAPAFQPADELLGELAARMGDPPGAGTVELPVGYLVLGQFIVHDLTFDDTALGEQRDDPDALRNFRTPRFDLDVVYGGGPQASPELYDPADPPKLLVGPGPGPGDLPRRADGTALLGDRRNDEHLFLTQLHVAFLRFHNAVVDQLRGDGVPSPRLFEAARQAACWHYQWLVLHDFLPRIVEPAVLGSIIPGTGSGPPRVRLRHYHPKNPLRSYIPLEFSAAAFRFGHSMMPGTLAVNDGARAVPLFGADAKGDSLEGGRPLPTDLVVDWRHTFEVAGPPRNRSRPLDPALAPPLHDLPASVVPPPDAITSLAHRNLVRGKRVGLASGQDVATALGATPLSNAELGLGPEWGGHAPLWFYVLKEAELQAGGRRLGPVGGVIVAEVLLGLLSRDPGGFWRRQPRFRPEPPLAPAPGRFTMPDLLRAAGVA